MSAFSQNFDVEPFARDLTINILSEAPVVGIVMGPIIGLFWTDDPLPRILTIGEVTDIASATYHKLSGEKEHVAMVNLVKGYKRQFSEKLSAYATAAKEDAKAVRARALERLLTPMNLAFTTDKEFEKQDVSAELTLVPFIGFANIHLALLLWLAKNIPGGSETFGPDLEKRRDEYKKYANKLVLEMRSSRRSTISKIQEESGTVTAGGGGSLLMIR